MKTHEKRYSWAISCLLFYILGPHQLRHFSRFLCSLLALSFVLLFSPPAGFTADVIITWDPSESPTAAGYMVYVGHASRTYVWSEDVGALTRCTLKDLDEDQAYYVAVTTYDTTGRQSRYSEELVYRVPGWDSDRDGLPDLEEADIYVTDPWLSDTDGDGALDGHEVYHSDDPLDPSSKPDIKEWADYRVGATLSSNDNDSIGIIFRYTDENNYYRFSWDLEGKSRQLIKKTDGQYALLAKDQVPYITDDFYRVEILALGSNLEVWIDGDRVFSVSDPSLRSGTIGFFCYANQGGSFDDVSVESLATGEQLLDEDFSSGLMSIWRVVDEGETSGPSNWSAASGVLVQSSNIYSPSGSGSPLAKPGTYVVYEGYES